VHAHRFKLQSSKHVKLIIVIVFLLSLVVTLLLPIPRLALLCVFFIVAAYGFFIFWRIGLLKGNNTVQIIDYHADGRFFLFTPHSNHGLSATLRGDSVVTTTIAVLRFNIPNRRLPFTVIVWKDALLGDEYRQLIVLLKTGVSVKEAHS